jgi:hypothetical protein
MGTPSSQRAVALAILGILVALIDEILATVKAPEPAIVACSGVTLLLIPWLYRRVLWGFYLDAREERQRKARRAKRKLRLVAGEEADNPPAELDDRVYGYEVIFSVKGLRSGEARLKPDRTTDDGRPYPLEIHKFDGEVWLVGYVSPRDKVVAEDAAQAGDLSLWMRRTRAHAVLVEIPLSRIDGEPTSRGDRSRDSTAKNIFRLLLKLTADRPSATASTPVQPS